mmetsp:Transcript_1046/g.2049  ORF Transcript_1046/g.2049 Transcript_1046/m.2049 type:complete len:206 (-) Transcript_1046:873-1490(-)
MSVRKASTTFSSPAKSSMNSAGSLIPAGREATLISNGYRSVRSCRVLALHKRSMAVKPASSLSRQSTTCPFFLPASAATAFSCLAVREVPIEATPSRIPACQRAIASMYPSTIRTGWLASSAALFAQKRTDFWAMCCPKRTSCFLKIRDSGLLRYLAALNSLFVSILSKMRPPNPITLFPAASNIGTMIRPRNLSMIFEYWISSV